MSELGSARARARLIELALSLPGAYEDHPWGETVAKVGKKVFAFFGTDESKSSGFVCCVKLPSSGAVALALPHVTPAGYGLGKSGWVYVKLEPKAKLPSELLEEWLFESYRSVAPKKLVKELDGTG